MKRHKSPTIDPAYLHNSKILTALVIQYIKNNCFSTLLQTKVRSGRADLYFSYLLHHFEIKKEPPFQSNT